MSIPLLVLAMAWASVCLSNTLCSFIETVQAGITKFLLYAAIAV